MTLDELIESKYPTRYFENGTPMPNKEREAIEWFIKNFLGVCTVQDTHEIKEVLPMRTIEVVK